MKKPIIVILCLTLSAVILPLCLVSCVGCRYVNNAADTLYNETKASELLRKYTWFKQAAATADAKLASIKLYESRITQISSDYAGKSAGEWQRADRDALNQWRSEYAGIVASYNALAAEYNAAMSSINWRFCNVGTLPQGAIEPLPREFRPYLQQ
jgi:hypothetical protein